MHLNVGATRICRILPRAHTRGSQESATAIENDTLLITLTEDKSITTDNLIVDDTSVSSWKSPTQILLQEFED